MHILIEHADLDQPVTLDVSTAHVITIADGATDQPVASYSLDGVTRFELVQGDENGRHPAVIVGDLATCTATRADGAPCTAKALPGRDVCLAHSKSKIPIRT